MNLLERFDCPFCEKNKFKSIYKKNYSNIRLSNFIQKYYKSVTLNEILKSKYYNLCKCLNCEGIFQKFIPNNELSNFLYDEIISTNESYNKKLNFIENNKNKLEQDFLMISNLFNGKLKNIKILEFGSGWGYWSKFMKSKSLNVSTCEFSKKRHQYLVKNHIRNFRFLEQINEKFDFIYSEEVLEHVAYPLKSLNQLNKILNINGYMFHRFPSSFLFETKLNERYIPNKDCAHPLEHINIIKKRTFYKMSQSLNLNICNSLKFQNQNFFTKLKIIKNQFI
ncbi:class I SAM-dependent methyltransferase, partial [Candidatus Pelagibacter sp. HIMB1506]|uniref:class I SAM-dependent methyltransferase n=1 Tax=Candidatus Pelagibacter sp. HIMB1506 TaxID=3413337 RepID=UPI003F842ADE